MQVQTSASSTLQLISEETDRLYEWLVALRRDIHAHPEVGNEEYRTTQVVVETLATAGLSAEVLRIGTGAVCDILPTDGASPDDLIGLRADLDALPIQDGKNVAYRSRNDGVCHACGHDVHTTVVLGVGLVLAAVAGAGTAAPRGPADLPAGRGDQPRRRGRRDLVRGAGRGQRGVRTAL